MLHYASWDAISTHSHKCRAQPDTRPLCCDVSSYKRRQSGAEKTALHAWMGVGEGVDEVYDAHNDASARTTVWDWFPPLVLLYRRLYVIELHPTDCLYVTMHYGMHVNAGHFTSTGISTMGPTVYERNTNKTVRMKCQLFKTTLVGSS